ncbi:hypothetical protein HMPREF3214_01493 [Alloscardovia omnicolens]|uniref:Uncharacterized protein n=1 Tax=Alloscardovia omnicolens F0580 TaxID=1321816 RepID=U1SHP2_9BIFI|nr:hypothetical protein HMPREF9244_00493 [Alloscardovia omnicolens F0580]KWZ73418.1 hypothetical protein HMPREF3214_01493 [Alloscardovia omnicolens]
MQVRGSCERATLTTLESIFIATEVFVCKSWNAIHSMFREPLKLLVCHKNNQTKYAVPHQNQTWQKLYQVRLSSAM